MTKSTNGRYTPHHMKIGVDERIQIIRRPNAEPINEDTIKPEDSKIMRNEPAEDYNQDEIQNRFGTWLSNRPAFSVLIASIGLIVFGILIFRAV